MQSLSEIFRSVSLLKRLTIYRVFYELIDEVMERADREGIISSNESVDDISTGTLHYLFLPYFYAKVCGRCPVLARLAVSNAYMHRYLERCFKLRVVSEEDVTAMFSEGAKVGFPAQQFSDAIHCILHF